MSIRMKIEMFYNIECNNKFNMLLLGSLQYIKKSFENQYMCCVSVGFSGISGVFRFREDGVVERLLEIYEVINNHGNSLDPAPFQFEVEETTKF